MRHDLGLPILHDHHVARDAPVIPVAAIPAVVQWLLDIAGLPKHEGHRSLDVDFVKVGV